jgi:UDP-N-acetylmuramoyl-L-alanyl-D-glutamate--2,6-diaminopimelate ligase
VTLVGIARPVPAAFPWAEPFSTIGVTGTNGKTSTSHFMAAILQAAGSKVVCQSTLGYFFDAEEATIERSERGFFQALERASAGGCRHAVVEVTSKALAQGYARKWRFDHAVFTNLTRDHVAEHGSWEHYLASKAQLFVHLGPGRTAVLNAHDEGAMLIDRIVPEDVHRVWYGSPTRGPALRASDLAASAVTPSLRGTTVELVPSSLAERLGGALEIGLIGEVYAENALAAAALALSLDIDARAVHQGLAACRTLPGRFDIVNQSPCVVLDFAHTPDALSRVCDTARRLAGAHRVLVVFGAAFVTNENPRHEDPRAIMETVARGCRRANRALTRVVPDRREAIRAAVAEARAGDLVLVTGRGREEGLVDGSVVLPYSDQAAVRDALTGS